MNSFHDDYFNLQPQHKSEMREAVTPRQQAECVTKRDATEKTVIVQRNLEDRRRKLLDYHKRRSVAIMRATLHRVTTPRQKAQQGIWPRLMPAGRRPLDSFPDVTSGDVNKLGESFISATFSMKVPGGDCSSHSSLSRINVFLTGVYILKDSDIIMVSAHKLPCTRHGPRARAELGRGKKENSRSYAKSLSSVHVNVNREEVQGRLSVKTCHQPGRMLH